MYKPQALLQLRWLKNKISTKQPPNGSYFAEMNFFLNQLLPPIIIEEVFFTLKVHEPQIFIISQLCLLITLSLYSPLKMLKRFLDCL